MRHSFDDMYNALAEACHDSTTMHLSYHCTRDNKPKYLKFDERYYMKIAKHDWNSAAITVLDSDHVQVNIPTGFRVTMRQPLVDGGYHDAGTVEQLARNVILIHYEYSYEVKWNDQLVCRINYQRQQSLATDGNHEGAKLLQEPPAM